MNFSKFKVNKLFQKSLGGKFGRAKFSMPLSLHLKLHWTLPRLQQTPGLLLSFFNFVFSLFMFVLVLGHGFVLLWLDYMIFEFYFEEGCCHCYWVCFLFFVGINFWLNTQNGFLFWLILVVYCSFAARKWNKYLGFCVYNRVFFWAHFLNEYFC